MPAVPLLWLLMTACAPSPTAPLGPTEPNPSDTVPADDTPAAADPRTPIPATLRRLTSTEHRNLLLDLLGAPLPPTPTAPDTDPYLFPRIGATTDAYSDLALQQLGTAAPGQSGARWSCRRDGERRQREGREHALERTAFGPGAILRRGMVRCRHGDLPWCAPLALWLSRHNCGVHHPVALGCKGHTAAGELRLSEAVAAGCLCSPEQGGLFIEPDFRLPRGRTTA